MTLDSVKTRFLTDMLRYPLPKRYTPAMLWEKVFNRRTPVTFYSNKNSYGSWHAITWACGYVEEDEGEPSIGVHGEILGCYGDHTRGLVNYINEHYGTDYIVPDGNDYIEFCIQNGLWFDSTFLLRIFFSGGYSYDGEYDEEVESEIMHREGPTPNPYCIATTVEKQKGWKCQILG